MIVRTDLIGQKFGRLTVIELDGTNEYSQTRWLCECCCGKKIIAQGGNLKNGHTQSCGCLKKETTKKINTTHGHLKNGLPTNIYKSWADMIQRCTNHNNKDYDNYGGRGIKVYNKWKKFPNFLKDMGEPPTSDYTLDRINNNDGYYPENCRWVTRKDQSRNKRNNHLITFNGKTQCLAAWAEEYNIHRNTLWSRISRDGWPMRKALTVSTQTSKSSNLLVECT